MEKILSSYAIIPDELYVERDADRQLARAISDMRKPPYVLVARQMGKTNLLLNATKRLRTEEDLYCYLDLTRRLPTLSDFFEYVIERILDSSESLRAAAAAEVTLIRQGAGGKLPAIAYEKCLLAILGHIPGKLVIIFDEVDSLANCTFSDSIFSQIRSVYFERSNESLKALRRLTYVLSGVAEPRELIKDRSISPFNIGDRIVLDDFSRAEVATFADRAKLAIRNEVLDRLYGRTGGNPRMVWDICSQLEDLLIAGAEPSPDDVDAVIERLYFGDLPSPPIDHIRSLVTDDRELRSAVIAIHHGDFARISDIMRSRLFLAGIARSVSGETHVEWRNGVVRQSLSPEWLSSLPDASLEALQRFDKAFTAGDYSEAERVFGTEIQIADIPLATRHRYLLRRSHVLVGLNRFDEAIAMTESFESDVTCPYTIRMSAIYLRAGCYSELGRDSEALAEFTKVAASDGDVDQRAFAKYRLTGNLLRLRGTADVVKQSVEALQEAVRFVEDKREALQPRTIVEILGSAHLSLGQILHGQGSSSTAIESLKKCIAEGSDDIKLRGAKELLEHLSDESDRRTYLEIACRPLVTREPSSASRVAPVDRQTVVHLGSWASQLGMNSQYDALLAYAIRTGIVSNDSVNALKLEIWAGQSERADIQVLRDIIDGRATLADETVGLALAYFVATQRNIGPYIRLFLERLEWAAKNQKLTESDFQAMHAIFQSGLDDRQIYAAERAAEILQDIVSYKPYHELLYLWLAAYFAAIFLSHRKKRFRAENLADFFLKNAPLSVLEKGFGKATSESILKRLKSLSISTKREQSRERAIAKIGRNAVVRVKYTDGRIVASKYKRIEDDLKLGSCVLIP